MRKYNSNPDVSIKDMEITGEKLNLIAVDSHNNKTVVSWTIIRDDNGVPVLENPIVETDVVGEHYFMKPVLKSLTNRPELDIEST